MDDDQSHYEISMTAGQAFVAFVLLLLSLAASFAFGLLIGRNQTDDRLVVRREPAVISEGSVAATKSPGKIVELGVSSTDTAPATTTVAPAPTATTATNTATTNTTASVAAPTIEPVAPAPARKVDPAAAPPVPAVPAYAQILSTTDQKAAETMAAKVIEGGFNGAYVEPTTTAKGTVYRVRIKFATEADAHAAEAKLKTFSRDVWITRQ